jgi:hypothetical protein
VHDVRARHSIPANQDQVHGSAADKAKSVVWLQTPVGRSKVAVLRERGDHGLKTIGFTPAR